jgi:uncharacterized surface protein with fasciclin (FAS1) repeats
MKMSRNIGLLLAAPALMMVSACGSDDAANGDAATDAAPTDKTLAELLAGADGMSRAASALTETGLAGVLDATPNYTVLAPTDAAFDAFAPADGAADASEEDQRAALSAVMRAHILPGYLTAQDINRAIDAADGGSVTMRSMADTALTFTREGEGIKITAEDGSSAMITGTELDGTNGVLLPIDTVLKQL